MKRLYIQRLFLSNYTQSLCTDFLYQAVAFLFRFSAQFLAAFAH
jgi:hypothetical protein